MALSAAGHGRWSLIQTGAALWEIECKGKYKVNGKTQNSTYLQRDLGVQVRRRQQTYLLQGVVGQTWISFSGMKGIDSRQNCVP